MFIWNKNLWSFLLTTHFMFEWINWLCCCWMRFEDWDVDDNQAVVYIHQILKTHAGDSSNFKVQKIIQKPNLLTNLILTFKEQTFDILLQLVKFFYHVCNFEFIFSNRVTFNVDVSYFLGFHEWLTNLKSSFSILVSANWCKLQQKNSN